MSRSRLLVVLVSLVLGAGMVPSMAQAQPRGSLSAGPSYQEPAVGQCYDLTTKQALKASSTKGAVPCDAPHTTMTVKVNRLPKDVRWKTLTASRFYVACEQAVVEALGGSTKLAAMSAYTWIWFRPTEKERAQGARWVRCDIIRLKGTGLGGLPTLFDLGSLPLDTEDARCLAGQDLYPTSCQQAHRYRAKAAFKLDRLPKTAEQYRQKARRCANLINAQRYAYDGPSADEWRAGDHWMVCFKPD